MAHLATIGIAIAYDGADWGATAWILDIAGLLAGIGFAVLCWLCARRPGEMPRSTYVWIGLWAALTLCVRVLDTLMLLGVVELSSIYQEPHGATFWANLMSEVILGTCFAIAALLGSVTALRET
jgi:hypothetical protein